MTSGAYIESSAVLSECQRYRFSLTRVWDADKPAAVFVMLNPSTADGSFDDPTIKSCVRLAKALGYGGLIVVNIFAWRATNPRNLPAAVSEAIGVGNYRHIESALIRCKDAICAWGADPRASAHSHGVLDIISLYKPRAYCFGMTASGAPRHPLYIKTGSKLETFMEFQNDR